LIDKLLAIWFIPIHFFLFNNIYKKIDIFTSGLLMKPKKKFIEENLMKHDLIKIIEVTLMKEIIFPKAI